MVSHNWFVLVHLIVLLMHILVVELARAGCSEHLLAYEVGIILLGTVLARFLSCVTHTNLTVLCQKLWWHQGSQTVDLLRGSDNRAARYRHHKESQ